MLAGAASPLRGVRVLELAGLAPVPLAGLMLRHAGASVIRIDRCGSSGLPDVLAAGKRSIALNLKTPEGSRVVQQLVEQADVLLDPFRPGALEATGLAPARLLEFNPRLIVARLTGYGQDAGGPLVRAAGHDINYVAVSGVLSLLHRPGAGSQPQVPLNLLADFAAGSALAVAGIAMALFERSQSGRGGVVDVSMAAGTAYLASLVWNLQREGLWDTLPFLAPGSAPWYDVYSTADDRWVALGALEPQFYALLLKVRLGYRHECCLVSGYINLVDLCRESGCPLQTGRSMTRHAGRSCGRRWRPPSLPTRCHTGHTCLTRPARSPTPALRLC